MGIGFKKPISRNVNRASPKKLRGLISKNRERKGKLGCFPPFFSLNVKAFNCCEWPGAARNSAFNNVESSIEAYHIYLLLRSDEYSNSVPRFAID